MPFRRIITLLATVLALPALAVAGGTARAAAPPSRSDMYFPAPVYVSLQGAGAIAVFPGDRVWHGFPQAHYLALGPRGKWLIVSGFSTGNVYLADTATRHKVATLHIGNLVQGVKIDPDGKYALAADASGGSVAVISLAKRKVVKSIRVGKSPHNIVFSRDGRTAYVTVQGANKLAVIAMDKLRVEKTLAIPDMDGPHNLDLGEAGKRLWIRSHSAPKRKGTVAVMNVTDGKMLRHFRVGPFHGGITTMQRGRYVAATNIGSNTVDIFNPETLARVKTVTVDQGPHGIRPGPHGRWLYVGATRGAELDIIDTRTLKIARRIMLPKGSFPFWIAVPGHS